MARGFANLSPEQRKAIASMGGKAAHAKGTAHKYTSEEASRAAAIAYERKTAHEWTPEEAVAAGKKGGKARAAKLKAAQQKAMEPIAGT